MTGRSLLLATVAGCLASALLAASVGPATADTTGAAVPAGPSGPSPANAAKTATPIKHLVVIFNENVSFDHYFATYPSASNPPGEPRFVGVHGTPRVDSLASANLLTKNPNTNPENGADAALPFGWTARRPTPPTKTTPIPRNSRRTTAARPTCSRNTPARARPVVPAASPPRAR
jgi:hypothetical protein